MSEVLELEESDMANDEALIERIRHIFSQRKGSSERKMFGGVCFMINGNMCFGNWKGSLLVRLDKKQHEETLAEPHTKPANITGRVMKGWALVEPAGIESEHDLTRWVDRAAEFVGSLPAKSVHASSWSRDEIYDADGR